MASTSITLLGLLVLTGCMDIPLKSVVGASSHFKPCAEALTEVEDPSVHVGVEQVAVTTRKNSANEVWLSCRNVAGQPVAGVVSQLLSDCMSAPLRQLDPSRCIKEVTVSTGADLPVECVFPGATLRVVPKCSTTDAFVGDASKSEPQVPVGEEGANHTRIVAENVVLLTCHLQLLDVRDPHHPDFIQFQTPAGQVVTQGDDRVAACARALAIETTVAGLTTAWIRW
jgi:hypothetical protein